MGKARAAGARTSSAYAPRVSYGVADRHDLAGDLDAGRVGWLAVGAEPHPHVREVDADSLRLDDDLARAGLRLGGLDHFEHVGPAGPLRHDLSHEILLTRTRRMSLF